MAQTQVRRVTQSLRRLLKRDEARRVGGADTWATVGNRLVRDGELTKVVADHLRLFTKTQRHTSVLR